MKTALLSLSIAVVWMFGSAMAVAAGGEAPSEATCADDVALATAPSAVQGGCIAIHRRKGRCNACHSIAGVTSGDVAPPLAFMADRFPDRSRLRAQVEDPRWANPGTVMPPFGAHHILTADEIDKVVDFLLTL
jgi:L-cysteine S-thiosulfotransferase